MHSGNIYQTIVLFVVVALQASAAPGFRILSACDESAEVRANIPKDARLEVHSAASGGSTCYAVTATIDGKELHGYVVDRSLDAVVAFEKANAEFSRKALSAVPVPPAPPAAPPPAQGVAADSSAVEKPKPAKEVPKPHKQPIISD
jgi:hypothetical protein